MSFFEDEDNLMLLMNNLCLMALTWDILIRGTNSANICCLITQEKILFSCKKKFMVDKL